MVNPTFIKSTLYNTYASWPAIISVGNSSKNSVIQVISASFFGVLGAGGIGSVRSTLIASSSLLLISRDPLPSLTSGCAQLLWFSKDCWFLPEYSHCGQSENSICYQFILIVSIHTLDRRLRSLLCLGVLVPHRYNITAAVRVRVGCTNKIRFHISHPIWPGVPASKFVRFLEPGAIFLYSSRHPKFELTAIKVFSYIYTLH